MNRSNRSLFNVRRWPKPPALKCFPFERMPLFLAPEVTPFYFCPPPRRTQSVLRLLAGIGQVYRSDGTFGTFTWLDMAGGGEFDPIIAITFMDRRSQ